MTAGSAAGGESPAGRIAAAPISWGVCEVPGWGYQMAPERVLSEMAELVAATEFGPDGFLPVEPAARAGVLAAHGLGAVGGFMPVVAHEPDHDPLPELKAALDAFVAAKAEVVVLAAATGVDGYDSRPELDAGGWRALLRNLDRLGAAIAERGLTATLHPHVGTMVETGREVDRVLAGSGIGLCLDTGHLLIGGTDPAELARTAGARIVQTHLKDVDAALADRVRAGGIAYYDAVRDGMYRPLGAGDVDLPGVLAGLRAAGYGGWYVLEQDTVLTAEPPAGAGPVADVRASLDYLRGVL
jgi:inosose dehydratase